VDAALERERAERKRYMANFLAVEREATDKDLVEERNHADQLVAGRDEFLAIVSHDLRSFLGGLSLSAGLIVDQAPEGDAGDGARKYGAMSRRLIARMNRLIDDLLDVASIDAGKLALRVEEVDVGELLRDTLAAFASIGDAKQLDLDVAAVAPPLHARADGGRILQVLANLVSNAMKFTPAGGRISVRARREGDEVEIAVSDTGIGITEDALQTVFERFRQIAKDRRGLGIGLHISKVIVEAHGGRIWAVSQPGGGTTFRFTLPVAR
jgi:signal transduction histidine kinase